MGNHCPSSLLDHLDMCNVDDKNILRRFYPDNNVENFVIYDNG